MNLFAQTPTDTNALFWGFIIFMLIVLLVISKVKKGVVWMAPSLPAAVLPENVLLMIFADGPEMSLMSSSRIPPA